MSDQPQGRNTTPRRRTSGLAVASFWLAIITTLFTWVLKLFCRCEGIGPISVLILEVIPFIMGLSAVLMIKRSRGALGGAGWAYAGIIISVAWSAATIHSHLVYSVTMSRVSCLNNLKQFGTAINMYERDHHDKLPSPEHWNEAMLVYAKNKKILICPSARAENLPGYAMNARLRGLHNGDIADPADTVMIFESAPGRNLYGGPELLLEKPRHPHWYNVAFCDGHAKPVEDSQIRFLKWNPKSPG